MANKKSRAKKKKAKKVAVKAPTILATKKNRKVVLVLKTVAVAPSSVDADVRNAVRSVTHYTSSTDAINTLYLNLETWHDAADDIEHWLVAVHGYAAFHLSRPESRSFHDKTFNSFIIFCRKKILDDGDKTDEHGPRFTP